MARVDDLLAQLAERNVPSRIEAAESLASHASNEPRVVPALRAALSDPEDTAVTEAAMNALLLIGTTEATEALLETLLHGDEETVGHLALFLDWAGQRGALADDLLRRYREA